jgi:hypothetical protein
MSDEFNKTLNLILKTSIDNYDRLSLSIEDIKKNITEHIEKSAGAVTDIQLLELKVKIIEKDFKELKTVTFQEFKKTNSDQHKEFYVNFKALDRIVYKISGGIILSGVIVGVVFKLINKG